MSDPRTNPSPTDAPAHDPGSANANDALDAAFLGLTRVEGTDRFAFVVTDHLSRMDGRLYGGTAIAVSIAAAEEVTGRTALWMTTQFVASAPNEAAIDVEVEILAPGTRTNQVRVTGSDAHGSVVFASLGATGHLRPDGLTGSFEQPPAVGPATSATPWATPFSGMAETAGIDPDALPIPGDRGFARIVELRRPAVEHHPDPGPGRVCVWARRRDRVPISPALASFLADMVPMSIARAFGVVSTGTSLDNTIRIGAFVPSEWVLIDLRPHFAVGGYGHGVAHVWSEDGALMATASQTASMRAFDPAMFDFNQT